MKKTIDVRLVVVAVLAGFLGGVLSYIGLPEHALAQAEPARQVTAQEFRVVDSEGKVLALTCISHHPTVEAHDTTARTSLRLLAVLNVRFKYACARQAARASS